jgi:hypothetical protein
LSVLVAGDPSEVAEGAPDPFAPTARTGVGSGGSRDAAFCTGILSSHLGIQ